jgi:hypothetical protein
MCACHLAQYCISNLPVFMIFLASDIWPKNTWCHKNNWEAHRAHCQNATQSSSFHVCLDRPRKHGTLASRIGTSILKTNSLPLLCGPWGRVLTPIEQVSQLYRPETHSIIAPHFRNAPLRHLHRCGGDDIYSWPHPFQTSGQNRQMCLGSRSDAGVCS